MFCARHISGIIRNTCGLFSLDLNSIQKTVHGFTVTRGLLATIRHESRKDKPISDTSVIVQDGTSMHEMPSIVQIVNGEFKVHYGGKTEKGEKFEGIGLETRNKPECSFKDKGGAEESEMIIGFTKCNSVHELFQLLDVCPLQEVTPIVAVAVMNKIFDLENGSHLLQHDHVEPVQTFTRKALIKQLIDTVCVSKDSQIIIDALKALSKDTNHERKSYLEPLSSECIIRVSEGKFTINQNCEVVKAFYNLGVHGNSYIDKVWLGINEKQADIDVEELNNIAAILPLVKSSRRYLYNIVERKFPMVWHNLDPESTVRIFQILVELKRHSSRLLGMLTRWTALNIHVLTEGNLRWIVYSLMTLNFTDDNIQHALSRYISIKKTGIKDTSLIAVVMDYCKKLRIRHQTILDSSANYFVSKAKNMPASQIGSFVTCFGHVNFTPENASAFFEVLEKQLHGKFADFCPVQLLDLFLSCLYLQRYPLNFVDKIFDPYFIQRINSLGKETSEAGKERLKILDKAFQLEVPHYLGSSFSRCHTKYAWSDNRILRCIEQIKGPLIEIAGSSERLSLETQFDPKLPHHRLYGIDCIVDMSGRKSAFERFEWPENPIAILVNVPEHFDVIGQHLIGPQVMKIRHLKILGYKVVPLCLTDITKLYLSPEKLKVYVENKMQTACKSDK